MEHVYIGARAILLNEGTWLEHVYIGARAILLNGARVYWNRAIVYIIKIKILYCYK